MLADITFKPLMLVVPSLVYFLSLSLEDLLQNISLAVKIYLILIRWIRRTKFAIPRWCHAVRKSKLVASSRTTVLCGRQLLSAVSVVDI